MPVAPTVKSEVASLFPAEAVEHILREELAEAVVCEASLHGLPIPKSPTALASLLIEIDSLVVVDLLCAVEPTLGFELREDVVQVGGYRSINEAVSHLMPRIKRRWVKRKGSQS
jgi:acyl carrier protein